MQLFIVTLHIFAIFNQIVMALILWLRKNNTLANKILGLIIIIPVFPFINNLLVYLDKIGPVFFLLYFNASIGLLFGPALLYYFNLMIGREIKFKAKHFVHFIPSLITTIMSLSLLFLNDEEKAAIITRVRSGTDNVTNILSLALLLHILFYLFLSWRMQKKHFLDVQSFYTDFEHTRYRWVRKFIRWLVVLNFLFIAAYLIPALFAPGLMMYADLVAAPFLTFLIYLFILIADFSNQAVFTDAEYKVYEKELAPFNEYIEESVNNQKYGSSALKEEVIVDIQGKLSNLLKEQKPYLDKELNLNKLADLTGVSSHQLSQFINRTHNKKFYDFINFYRVEEAKLLLMDSSRNQFKFIYERWSQLVCFSC